jgi:hypothetical protein
MIRFTEAQAKIPMNPTFSTRRSIPSLARSNQFWKEDKLLGKQVFNLPRFW